MNKIRLIIDHMLFLISPNALINAQNFRKLKNIHKGERCFVLGNGPSLARTNLSLLTEEYVFGLNRIYLHSDFLSLKKLFYVSVNSLLIDQCYKEINQINKPKFLSWYKRNLFVESINPIYYIRDPYLTIFPRFSSVPYFVSWEGATVTYVALQIAYYLGFSQVILLGVDHNFATKGEPHKKVISKGQDMDHFSKDYFGKGFVWQLPDLDKSEYSYLLAKNKFEKHGRKIVDATIDGKLTIFDKIDFTVLFNQKY